MIWWYIAAICAYFVKGLCGFANTLVFSTMLSFTNNNINITPVELLVGYPSNIIIAWKERKSVSLRVWLPLALIVLLGNIPGMLLLKNVNVDVIKIIFGFVIIGIGTEMLIRENSTRKVKESKPVMLILGIISGMLCGMFGIGALTVAYMARVTKDSKAMKANLCIVFIVENTFRIIVYTFMGILTADILKNAALLLPAMVIGLYAGMKSSSILSERVVKRIVIIMLIILGAILLFQTMNK